MLKLRFFLALAASAICLLALAASPASAAYESYLAPIGNCPGQNNRDAMNTTQERAMECLINCARAKRGLGKVSGSTSLRSAALGKAGDINNCNDFSHTACGRSWSYWFSKVGYLSGSSWTAAENIAWGSGTNGTARSRMHAWLNSDGHRANIFSSKFNQQGVALLETSFLGYSGAAIWVSHFGKHSGC